MGTSVEVVHSSVSGTRNSVLREKTAGTIKAATNIVHKVLPWLSPTHLNFLGGFGVVLGSVIAASRDPKEPGGEKEKTTLAAALIASGSGADAFDGALARIMAAEDPSSVDFERGQIYDALSDRAQESALALSRARSANKTGGMLGRVAELAAFLTAITSSLPSVSRAVAESLGKAVPESGRGLFGLIGTRPGRAVIGGAATLYPKPKGLPVHLGADILMTTSNVVTTVDRFRTALSKEEGRLPEEIRGDAKTRLKVLAAFTAVSAACSLFTYIRQHRRQEQSHTEEALKENGYLGILSAVERYCQEHSLDHRFVGGTLTDLIGPHTEFEINIRDRAVTLKNSSDPTLERSDGTVKDIDVVVFTPDQSKFLEARREFARWKIQAKAQGLDFPTISLEAARHPDWPKRSRLKQFVTAWEVDKQGVPHLGFETIDQAIRPISIEPWLIGLGGGTQITTFNPVAHALCYALRVPSGIKRKDMEIIGWYDDSVVKSPYSKMTLVEGLARQTIADGLRRGVNYNDVYREWADYIEALSKGSDLMLRLKRIITGVYWNTLGTQISHGRGIFGRLSAMSDKFAG